MSDNAHDNEKPKPLGHRSKMTAAEVEAYWRAREAEIKAPISATDLLSALGRMPRGETTGRESEFDDGK